MTEPSPEIAQRVALMSRMAQRAWDQGAFFFYVRIPESLEPEERIEKYERPLGDALRRERLGKVTGGGQQLGPGKTVAYCGVDVFAHERVRGLERIREVLTQLRAPHETVIEEFIPKFVEHPLMASN